LNAAERRLKAGDLAPADVAKVQVDFERAQNDARGAQADLARAQIALAYLLALEAEARELRAVETWPALERADAAAAEDAIDARWRATSSRARRPISTPRPSASSASRARSSARRTAARRPPSSRSAAAPSRFSRCWTPAGRCAPYDSKRSARAPTTPKHSAPGAPRRRACNRRTRDDAPRAYRTRACPGRVRPEGAGAAAAVHGRAAQRRHLRGRQSAGRLDQLGADRAAPRHGAALQRPPGMERGPHGARLRALWRTRELDRGA